MLALGLLTAPPGRDVGKLQGLAAQGLDARQERQQRPCLEDPRAQRIDHRQVRTPHGLHEAGRAQARALVQLQRIGVGRIEAAPQHADGGETCHRAHHDLPLLDSQVLAFQQHEAQVTCNVGMLEIGVVPAARAQDRDLAVLTCSKVAQRVTECLEEPREPVHLRRRIKFREHARGRDPVLERKARTRWRLRSVTQHPPVPIGPAPDFECDEAEIVTRTRLDANKRTQPLLAHADQRRRKVSLCNQPVLAIEVSDDALQQLGALHEAFRDPVPLALMDDDGNVAERPVTLGRFRRTVLPEEHTRIAKILVTAVKAACDLGRLQPQEVIDEVAPDRAHGSRLVNKFIRNTGKRLVGSQRAGQGLATTSGLR